MLHLPDIPGCAEAFEQCAKFCYSITITLSALNIVPVRCAAEYLGMTEEVDRGNLVSKLDVFLKSCILHRWKDTLVTLQSSKQYPELSEKLRITSQCVEAIASMIINKRPTGKGWWAEDIAQLGIDLYWRIMVAVKSSGSVTDKVIGGALKVYACKWLPTVQRNQVAEINSSCMGSFQEITSKHRLILERIVSLLPMEKGSVSCSFLLKLLKAGNILNASSSSKMELVRRVGMQLDEATVTDLLIPSLSYNDETLYDVDLVMSILEEFMLQGQSPRTSPTRGKFGGVERRRRSRSAEDIDFEGVVQENSRRSSSASHGSKLRVAKLIDGYLQEIAKDTNLPMEKVIALAEAVPDFARPDHDDLYRVVDTYLRAHPDLDKTQRKRLCRILNCKKLSVEVCMHAAQNEWLPLRMVVQVLFFEQTRAAMNGGDVAELPQSLKALLAKTNYVEQGNKRTNKMPNISNVESFADDDDDDDEWSMPGFKTPRSKLATLKMKLAEADNDVEEEDVMQCDGLGRSASSRFKSICSIPSKPKRILSKLWAMNRSVILDLWCQC